MSYFWTQYMIQIINFEDKLHQQNAEDCHSNQENGKDN